jgi:Cft2 family RNA processing exonuclease
MFSLTEKSLYVAAIDLWIDSMRERDRCYVSHGHADHARAHGTIVTSVNNARVCRLRFRHRPGSRAVTFEEHAFNEPWNDGEHRLTLFSAGHVLGSSQLLIEGDAGSFVYTGDFKLANSYTCEQPEVKKCDVLLMECTFGRPQYVFPPRDEIEGRIVAFATRALADGRAPVFFAYALGKAQEAMAILTRANIPVTAHSDVYAMAGVYGAAGVQLGTYAKYDPHTYDGTRALVWPPSRRNRPKAIPKRPFVTAMLTGWAVDAGTQFRYGADEMIPLSDHADFPSLVRYIERAEPKKVLLNHGWRDFAWQLRRLGINAVYLEEHQQLAMFSP